LDPTIIEIKEIISKIEKSNANNLEVQKQPSNEAAIYHTINEDKISFLT